MLGPIIRRSEKHKKLKMILPILKKVVHRDRGFELTLLTYKVFSARKAE